MATLDELRVERDLRKKEFESAKALYNAPQRHSGAIYDARHDEVVRTAKAFTRANNAVLTHYGD